MNFGIFEILRDQTITKTGRIILFSVFALPIFFVVGMLVYFDIWPDHSYSREKEFRSDFVHERVISVFNDDRNHNVRTAMLTGKKIYLIEYTWESKIDAGDSLSKDTGSFILNVIKKDTTLKLDYRDILKLYK